MNVVFVQPAPDAVGMLTRRIRRAAESLANRDHEATVLCIRWWDGEDPAFERNGVTYRAVTDSPRWFAAKLPATLSRMEPDVIHVAGSVPDAALAVRLSGVPLVLDWCGEADSRLLDRALLAADRACALRVRPHEGP